jgi:hypothetical protein
MMKADLKLKRRLTLMDVFVVLAAEIFFTGISCDLDNGVFRRGLSGNRESVPVSAKFGHEKG